MPALNLHLIVCHRQIRGVACDNKLGWLLRANGKFAMPCGDIEYFFDLMKNELGETEPMKIKTVWAIGACAVLLTACGSDQEASMENAKQQPDNSLMQVISGDVWYRERIALPPGAKVIVTLEDQSRADAPATVITDHTHIVDGQGPYSFRLVYDPAAIDERMTYGLRARIEHDGRLMFSSTAHIDPFASEPGQPVRIMVSNQGRN